MEKVKQALLDDIRHNGGFMLATLGMKYASESARGTFGEGGLTGLLTQLEGEGLVRFEDKKVGVDYFKMVYTNN